MFFDHAAEVIVPGIMMLIPIIAILTSHQRKMAEIIHGRQNAQQIEPYVANEIAALRNEVAQLRTQLHQQMIAMDSLTPRQTPPPVSVSTEVDAFQQRLQ